MYQQIVFAAEIYRAELHFARAIGHSCPLSQHGQCSREQKKRIEEIDSRDSNLPS
jgi:hypothetical protein